jgi:predicted porin
MKRFTLSALALVAAAVAAPAFAQSSVTVYGRMNTTIENQKVNGGSRVWKLENNASRLGFKGVEDMGGGLKASFNLEHGLNSDNGASTGGTTFWGREAWVQLAGSFGAVRLGRFTAESYFATADYISMHNHDTGTSSDSLYAFAPFPYANKVGYFTPTMGGFSASLSMAAGEGAPGVKRSTDVGVNYDAGPLHLGMGWSDQGNNDQWAVRGLYELGAFTLGAYYQKASNYAGYSEYKAARAAIMYTMGASEFHVNYGRATNGDQYTLGYNYNLSKRTKIYGYWTDLDTARHIRRNGEFSSFAVGVRHN